MFAHPDARKDTSQPTHAPLLCAPGECRSSCHDAAKRGAGMDRGVVVGGLMICGSFLLATSLNRSAVKEIPPAAPAAAPEAPIAPALAADPADESKAASCDSGTSSSTTKPVVV